MRTVKMAAFGTGCRSEAACRSGCQTACVEFGIERQVAGEVAAQHRMPLYVDAQVIARR
jgi:hypothetical protein